MEAWSAGRPVHQASRPNSACAMEATATRAFFQAGSRGLLPAMSCYLLPFPQFQRTGCEPLTLVRRLAYHTKMNHKALHLSLLILARRCGGG
jgi:hypothetical protein